MMMDCPRCGFTQPPDQFCAKCGVDVNTFVPRPVAWWRRVLGRPGTYLGLAVILGGVVLFIVLSAYVPAIRAVRGQFVTSRDAAEREDVDPPSVAPTERAPAPPMPPAPEPIAPEPIAPEPVAVADSKTSAEPLAPSEPAAAASPAPKLLQAEFWEVTRGSALNVLSTGDRVAEDQDGRAIILRDPIKTRAWLKSACRSLGPAFSGDLHDGTQITIETPPGTPEPFRFGLMLQLTKWAEGHASLRFASAQALDGAAELAAGETLVIMMEPANRRPPPEVVKKAGPGPWVIFNSPNFRAGETAWIFTARLR